jgi:hypothetical protein
MLEARMHTGGCLCGGIRFSIDGELQPLQLCHCIDCRKAQGGAFASVLPVSANAFTLQAGEELLQRFESSPGKERVFCGRCGSPIYSRRISRPGAFRIRAGLMDQPLPVRPAFHQFVANKANWWNIDDDLPQFPGAPS